MHCQRLRKFGVPYDVKQRCKGFFLNDIPVILSAGDCRFDKVARTIQHLAATQDFATRVFDPFERKQKPVHGLLVDQWPHQGVGFQRIANPDLSIGMHEMLFQFLRTARVDDDPAGTRATLARGANRAKGNRGHRQFQVCVFVHDDGVIAPQFQQGTPHALCDPMTNLATDRAGTGKGHEGNPRVVDEAICQ